MLQTTYNTWWSTGPERDVWNKDSDEDRDNYTTETRQRKGVHATGARKGKIREAMQPWAAHATLPTCALDVDYDVWVART